MVGRLVGMMVGVAVGAEVHVGSQEPPIEDVQFSDGNAHVKVPLKLVT